MSNNLNELYDLIRGNFESLVKDPEKTDNNFDKELAKATASYISSQNTTDKTDRKQFLEEAKKHWDEANKLFESLGANGNYEDIFKDLGFRISIDMQQCDNTEDSTN